MQGVVDNNRGVVLLALDSPIYGGWALNLAMGIKSTQSDCKITLLWQGDALTYIKKYIYLFDNLIEVSKEITNRNGFESLIRSKVFLYDLSPYQETIFIDADVIWFPIKSISLLFDKLNNYDFSIGCRSKNDLSNSNPRLIWSTTEDIKKHFGEVNIFNLSSEFIYFKKTEKIKEFFDVAKKYYDDPEINYVRFSGGVPDELAFQLAMIKTGIEPHQTPFLPFYWEPYEQKNKNTDELFKEDWFGYSIGGSTILPMQKAIYDGLANSYSRNFGVKFPSLARSKREVFKNRNTI